LRRRITSDMPIKPAPSTAKETAKVRLPYVQIRVQSAKQFEEGQYAGAAQAFEEALRLDPDASTTIALAIDHGTKRKGPLRRGALAIEPFFPATALIERAR